MNDIYIWYIYIYMIYIYMIYIYIWYIYIYMMCIYICIIIVYIINLDWGSTPNPWWCPSRPAFWCHRGVIGPMSFFPHLAATSGAIPGKWLPQQMWLSKLSKLPFHQPTCDFCHKSHIFELSSGVLPIGIGAICWLRRILVATYRLTAEHWQIFNSWAWNMWYLDTSPCGNVT